MQLTSEFMDITGQVKNYIHQMEGRSSFSWIAIASTVIAVWVISDIINNLIFSPLAKYPGPKLWSVSKIPYQWYILRGQSHHKILSLHDRYGPVIRVGPNELLFNTPQAFQEIYRARPGRPQYAKDPNFYGSILNPVAKSIVGSIDDKTHTRLRRLWADAFSEKALRINEEVILHYSDLMVQRLRERTAKGDVVKHQYKTDMKEWFNYIAFDVTGDLLFDETFDCLKDVKMHPWINLIFAFVKGVALAGVINQFALLRAIQKVVLPRSLRNKMLKHIKYSNEKAARRLQKGTSRPDFMSSIMKQGLVDASDNYIDNPSVMSRDEIDWDSMFVAIAGSETSATTLSGCVYFLTKEPEILRKLYEEISTTFAKSSDITAAKCANMKYLNAVIEESLRRYPPVAASLPRLVPPGGDLIDGKPVPEMVVVSTHHWASYHSSANWALPMEFIPERFLGDSRFESDKRDVLQPFSLGQRGCLGKNVAYVEARLILTKLVFNFDMELCSESSKWIDQEMYVNWDKPPLWVNLRDRLADSL